VTNSIIDLEVEKERREIIKINVDDRDWNLIRDKLEDTMWKSGLQSQALILATLNALTSILDSDGMNLDESKKRISDTLCAFLFW
jgi:hypothetical protein